MGKRGHLYSPTGASSCDRGGLDPEKTNVDGGAIALGHPVGATGAILAIKLMRSLERIDGRRGIVTMCIGGGQGMAAIFERP